MLMGRKETASTEEVRQAAQVLVALSRVKSLAKELARERRLSASEIRELVSSFRDELENAAEEELDRAERRAARSVSRSGSASSEGDRQGDSERRKKSREPASRSVSGPRLTSVGGFADEEEEEVEAASSKPVVQSGVAQRRRVDEWGQRIADVSLYLVLRSRPGTSRPGLYLCSWPKLRDFLQIESWPAKGCNLRKLEDESEAPKLWSDQGHPGKPPWIYRASD